MTEPKRVLYWGPEPLHHEDFDGRIIVLNPGVGHGGGFSQSCADSRGACTFTPATVIGGLTKDEISLAEAVQRNDRKLGSYLPYDARTLGQAALRLDSLVAVLRAKLEDQNARWKIEADEIRHWQERAIKAEAAHGKSVAAVLRSSTNQPRSIKPAPLTCATCGQAAHVSSELRALNRPWFYHDDDMSYADPFPGESLCRKGESDCAQPVHLHWKSRR